MTPARPSTIGARAPLIVVVCLLLLSGGIAAARGQPASTLVRAVAAARGGEAIPIRRVPVGGGLVVTAALPFPIDASPRRDAGRLLSISADGELVAVADRLGDRSGLLILVRPNGDQLRVALPGILSAGFAPDASWLAVLDAQGALWRVASADGASSRIAEGPFVGPPQVTADSIALLSVSSIEAPWRSTAVRLDTASGRRDPLSTERLVYGVSALADGRRLLTVHRPEGTQLRDAASGALVGDLGVGAVGVSLSADGRAAAFERAGQVFLAMAPDWRPSLLTSGELPRISPAGDHVLLLAGRETQLLTAEGAVLWRFKVPWAAFAACLEECE